MINRRMRIVWGSLALWCLAIASQASAQTDSERLEIREVAPIEGLSGEALTQTDALALSVLFVRGGDGALLAPSESQEPDPEPIEIPIGALAGETLSAPALRAALERIPVAYGALGYRGILVTADEPALARGVLRITVIEGRIGQIRTILRREDRDALVNDPSTARVRARAPLRGRDAEQPGDLVRIAPLDDFAHSLSRHPNRRADVALSPGPADGPEGEVTLDLLLTESPPLLLYAQASNTGTEETSEWRERFGLAHYNLTNNDDILTLDYITGDFDEIHALLASYEAPLTHDGRLRARAFARYSEFDASELGDLLIDFQGENAVVGGELALNVWQDGPAFVDLVAGLRYERHDVRNTLGIDTGNSFLLPSLAARYERRADAWSFDASVGVEFNLPGAGGTDDASLDQLGRFAADDTWTVLTYRAQLSAYLDELFSDEPSARAHELVLSARGRASLSSRLPPGFTDVAGGLYTVRGHPESFTSGDRSLIVSAEYLFHFPRTLAPTGDDHPPDTLLGSPFYWAPARPGGRTDWDLIFRAFVDAAWTENVERLAFERDSALLSAGVGLELAIKRNFRARVDVGWVLKDEASADDRVEIGDNEVHLVFTLVF